MSLDQDLPQPNGPDTCISFHEMTTPKFPPLLTHCVLVAGAQPGRKGAGCFKVSSEEKSRMADAAKAAARKLKAQQKQGLSKVKSSD